MYLRAHHDFVGLVISRKDRYNVLLVNDIGFAPLSRQERKEESFPMNLSKVDRSSYNTANSNTFPLVAITTEGNSYLS